MTFQELLNLLEYKGVALAIWAMQRWMWMIGVGTGKYPDWNDKAPIWVIKLAIDALPADSVRR